MAILALLTSCGRAKKKARREWEKIVDSLSVPAIKNHSLFEVFPEFKKEEYKIIEAQGILCEYVPFFYKYYFTYSGDMQLVQKHISNIECHYTEIKPDTELVKSSSNYFEEKIFKGITEQEKQMAQFFFAYKNLDLGELEFYTCVKTPEIHYLVFDLKNNFIYHMIENFRE